MRLRYRVWACILIAALTAFMAGCQRNALPTLSKEAEKTEKLLADKKTFHARQVVESYDENGTPLPRYFEVWVSREEALCKEYDAEGNVLRVQLDSKDNHISYDPQSLKAEKTDVSTIIALNLAKGLSSKDYKSKDGGAYTYCGRTCSVYTLENGTEADAVRMYIDSKTGFVLFCDAPLFCIKTASFEVIPYEKELYAIPDQLEFN
ncbi:MAG: hypothetical protein N2376_12555 [Clostridia bacterium]|nr:hypothetical protein [Clostridia bacterium]